MHDVSSPPIHARLKRAAGFGMLEVLVTLLVISFGLVGIASLQLSVKRASYQTTQRTLAFTLANDLMERIRINASAAASYGTAQPLTGATLSAPAACALPASCTPAEIAARDLFAWEQLLASGAVSIEGADAGGLINPTACVLFDRAGAMPATSLHTGQVVVVLSWVALNDIQETANARAFYTANPDAACGFDPATDELIARRQHILLASYTVAPEDLNI